MRIAKLVLFLVFFFIVILILAALLALLRDWIGSALFFSPNSGGTDAFSGKITEYLSSSIPAAFYLTVLLGLNYAARRRIAYPISFIFIWVFIVALSGAVFLGQKSLEQINFSLPLKKPSKDLAKPGLLLNNTVFLGDPYQPGSARAVLTPDQSLSYREDISLSQMRLPFFSEESEFFDKIDRDLERSSRFFSAWFNEGLLPYGVYAGSLAAFLLSLGCLINISFWSLANLFFGALAFRGALILENFLNQPQINQLLVSFARNSISESMVNPIIFCALSILILLYSGLVYLARGGRTPNG
ncbi:MAG: hypothetical protein FWG27_08350 [Treponema sp.]|jgi:hypothetical protein|nr:hypothetical protein [Treponema sp.]